MGNAISRYPDVVGASEVALIDGSIFLPPVCELDPTQVFRHLRDTANDGPPYETVLATRT